MPDLEKPTKDIVRYAGKPLSPLVKKALDAALTASADDVREYTPTDIDVGVAQAMLMGHTNLTAIAKEMKISTARVREVLQDSTRMAWVCDKVHRNVAQRLGMVDAAMMIRAISGDTRAAALLYKEYGKERVTKHLHLVGGVNFDKLSDEDLAAYARSAQKEDGIIDVEAGDDNLSEGSSGTEAP